MPIKAIDLFCGAGGLTHGLINAGIEVVAGFDLDPACQWPYETNNQGAKFFLKDVSTVTADELNQLFGNAEIRLLAGCAPCQPFSNYSLGKTEASDSRWSMLDQFSRLVEEVRPNLITMENVPQLIKHDIFTNFKNKLQALGYHVSVEVVACAKYGIPQNRRRLVLLGSLIGDNIAVRPVDPQRDIPKTVKEAIGNMPAINAGDIHPEDSLHTSSRLNAVNLARIRSSVPGGTWRDWNKDLILDCHKEDTGATFCSVYGRMEWDKPSPTITTQFYGFGNGRFGHPEQDRALSIREGAILQSFPIDYSFVPTDQKPQTSIIGRLIGNAVPVKLGQVIGESLVSHIRSVATANAV